VNENVWGKQKKKRRLPLSLDRNILSFVLFFSYEKKTTTEGNRKRQRKRIVCVCMRHMELLVVDTRRQAAAID
jgi:hypothetical protein